MTRIDRRRGRASANRASSDVAAGSGDLGPVAVPSAPSWVRHRHLPAVLALGLTLLAFGIEAVRLTLSPEPVLLTSVGVIVTATGLVSTRFHVWSGLAVGWAGLLVVAGSGWDPIVEYSAVAFTLFALIFRSRVRALAPTAATVVAVAAAFLLLSRTTGVALLSTDVLAGVASAVAAAALATALVAQRRYWDALEQHAASVVASREHVVQRRVIEERVRVARDLHDVIGHQVAVVSVHLGAVEVSAGRDAAATASSLAAARVAVRAILADTQRTVAVLREGAGSDRKGAPAPGLPAVAELVRSFQDIGMQVGLSLPDQLDGIDPGESLTAYRVVQEALTNARRYGTGRAEVRVVRRGPELRIEVENPVPEEAVPSVEGGGYGLIGMHERVSIAGGVLTAGAEDGRFRVTARLDVEGGRIA